MQKIVICTVGTSIANKCPAQKEMQKQQLDWENSGAGPGETLRSEIASFLSQNGSNPKNKADLKGICAEISVLSRLDMSPSDRVVLLASDNAQGRVCAEMLKKAVLDAFGLGEAAVEIRRIEGLQVLDAKKLREQGLKNLVKELLKYLADDDLRYSHDIILNPTGGFKGVIPFVTIMGMLYGRRSVYLFEFSEELINLPPLPFSFDMQLYSRVRPALDFVDTQVAVTEEAFLSKVVNFVPEERDLFLSFTEPFDEHQVTLSPLTSCLLKIDETAEKPRIAESALADLKKVSGEAGLVLKRLIMNSTKPLWRNNHIHKCFGSDLIVLKPVRTAQRIAGFFRDNRFLITNVFDNHDEYSATIKNYQRKDFEKAVFVTYETNEDLGADDDNPDEVLLERDKLLMENKALTQKIKDHQEAVKAQKTVQDDSILAELEEKETRIHDLEAGLAAITEKQPRAPKGFFARLRYLLSVESQGGEK